MRYWSIYGFMFRSEKWLTNMLAAILCQLVPIAGQMVFLGYTFEIVEYMHRRNSDERYPDFSTDRLVPYLIRGAWPFLTQLVMGIVVMPGVVGMMAAYFMAIFAAQGKMSPEPAIVVGVVSVILMVGLNILVALVGTPIYIRAGLMQDFAPAFSWRFISDFVKRVGGTLLLVILFEMLTMPFLVLVGMLACFVGVYFAGAIISFAQAHVFYQIYQLYLERGGTPIPLKPEEVPMRPPGEIVEDTYEEPGPLR